MPALPQARAGNIFLNPSQVLESKKDYQENEPEYNVLALQQ
jgi:hypothetical protein